MLIVLKENAAQSDAESILEFIKNSGSAAQQFMRNGRITLSVKNGNGSIKPAELEKLTGVDFVTEMNKFSQKASGEKRIVKIGDSEIGGNDLAIIAGVCAVESAEQVFTVAENVKKSGARFFRGGAFKPRTSPYAFQGLGEKGLQILAEVKENFGLNIITEAIDEKAVDLVEKYGDCIQIGSRNMQNFSLLKRAGRSHLPVLLKRGMSATLDEFLLAAEYISSEGNRNIILCERGIRTFGDHSRNTLDLSIVPAIRNVSDLPVIVDPSHGTGRNFMVAPLARAGVAVGADGIMVEIHPQPEIALSDGAQALLPEEYLDLAENLKVIYESLQLAAA